MSKVSPERTGEESISHPSDAVAADAADEAAHLQDVDRREHTVETREFARRTKSGLTI